MREFTQQFEELGARLVVVGNGQPHHAARFRDDFDLDFPLLVDPEMNAYRAAGLRRDLGSTFDRRLVKNSMRALKEGFRQKSVQGDPWQQGGAFVIDPDGEVLFSYISQVGGDHVDPQDLLETLRTAA